MEEISISFTWLHLEKFYKEYKKIMEGDTDEYRELESVLKAELEKKAAEIDFRIEREIDLLSKKEEFDMMCLN